MSPVIPLESGPNAPPADGSIDRPQKVVRYVLFSMGWYPEDASVLLMDERVSADPLANFGNDIGDVPMEPWEIAELVTAWTGVEPIPTLGIEQAEPAQPLNLSFEELESLVHAVGSWLEQMDDLVADVGVDDLEAGDVSARAALSLIFAPLADRVERVKAALPKFSV